MVKNRVISMLCLAVFSFCMAYAQTNGSSDNVYKELLEKIEKKQNDQTLKEFREKFTYENFLTLMGDYENGDVAKKCGLDLIYKNKISQLKTMIVYGYDVKKGKKKKKGYEIIPKSENACYIEWCPKWDSGGLHFKNRYDANNFYKQTKEYGLIVYDGDKFVPVEKYISESVSFGEEGAESEVVWIGDVKIDDGWYVIGFGFEIVDL